VVASLKGGVGKTTVAVYLAAVAAESARGGGEYRLPVRLVDADPQGSAAVWLEEWPLEDVEVFEAPSERLVSKSMSAPEDTVVVVDTPPGHERLAAVALKLADVVIIPTRVGGVEPTRVVATLSLVPAGVPAGLAISSARPNTRDHKETIAAWTADGVPIWGVIPQRVGIASGPEAGLHPDGLSAARDLWFEATSQAKRRQH
jgi:chromosome partitioning protein